jgi:predicted acylesterase/phospholipase RssA
MKLPKASALLCKLVFQVLMLIISTVTTVAADEPRQRLSFSISGGASLGAYEAGINWGLLTLMRYEAQKDHGSKGERYRPYEAASMTGASAGSINALLSVLTWCARHENDGGFPNRIDDNLFRNVWLSLDINSLLPPEAMSPIYQKDDAVLSRKDLLDAADMLRKTWNSPVFREGCRIPLGVTLTRVFPQLLHVGDIAVKNQRFTIPFEFNVKKDLSAGFYFNPDDYYYHSDYSTILLPTEEGKTNHEISDQRITQAILTSSAFPLAFGRKRLQYCRLSLPGSSNNVETSTFQNVRLKGLSCPKGYELSESEFADGGLFDNLPIGLARTLAEKNIRSKANPFPTTYIYLDPDRLRYEEPDKQQKHPCARENAPPSCDEMEYSFRSEIHLLVDAFGTARTYELYRELSSETWTGNIVQISRQFSDLLKDNSDTRACNELLPYFSEPISCMDALIYAGKLLETAYTHIKPIVRQPFSIMQLQEIGLLEPCTPVEHVDAAMENVSCFVDYQKFRGDYARRLHSLISEIQPHNAVLLSNIQYSQS